jgi:hypothetical protein
MPETRASHPHVGLHKAYGNRRLSAIYYLPTEPLSGARNCSGSWNQQVEHHKGPTHGSWHSIREEFNDSARLYQLGKSGVCLTNAPGRSGAGVFFLIRH